MRERKTKPEVRLVNNNKGERWKTEEREIGRQTQIREREMWGREREREEEREREREREERDRNRSGDSGMSIHHNLMMDSIEDMRH